MGKSSSQTFHRPATWVRHSPVTREFAGKFSTPEGLPEATHFALFRLASNGWSWFPQMRSGNRLPFSDESGLVFPWGRLQARRPDQIPLPKDYGRIYTGSEWVRAAWLKPGSGEGPGSWLNRWGQPCVKGPTLNDYFLNGLPKSVNAAIVLGEASGRTFAVDVDVSDPDLAPRVRQVVEDVLGRTPLVRHAGGPRMLLVYRYPEGEAESYRKSVWKLDFDDAAVEILWNKSPFTAAGRHHRTGHAWMWENGHPGLDEGITPALAPEVSVSDLEDLHQALRYRIGLRKERPRAAVASTAPVRDGNRVVPGVRQFDGVTYGDDGKIVDGRDNWAFHRSRDWVRANWDASESEVVAGMCAEAETLFLRGGPSEIRSIVEPKVRARFREKASGRLKPLRLVENSDGSFAPTPVVQVARETGDAEIEALVRSTRRSAKLVYSQTGADEAVAADRALIADRAPVRAKVAREMRAALEAWFVGLYTGSETVLKDANVFRAPTGAGKTSMAVQIQMEMRAARGSLGGPVVLMVPSYKNAEEIMARVEALREISPDFKAMVYEGKSRLCAYSDTMKTLQGAGIGTSNMCKWKDDEGDERKCDRYDGCPAILQQLEVPQNDLVILVQQFLTCQLPKCLKQPKALIVDESHWQHLLAEASFPIASLKLPRREPYATKKEVAEGTTKESLIWDRERVNEVIVEALSKRQDPALALRDWSIQATETFTLDGIGGVRSAIKVCQRASDHHKSVKPGITLKGAQELASAARDKDLLLELRLLRLIEERLDALRVDDLQRGLHEAAAANDKNYVGAFVPRAKGDRDSRIQVLGIEPTHLRISWRPTNNFAGIPLLMLDASASPEIVAKTWDHRKVVTTEIDAPLHLRVVAAVDRTRSTSSLLPGAAREHGPAFRCAKNLSGVRQVAAKVGNLFGNRLWGFCAPKAVNEALCNAWPAPPTMRTVHFGALRGLDYLKDAAAMLVVGRNEPSIQTLDGLVAALTYDDAEPELPVDRDGTGLDADGKPVLAGGDYNAPHVIRMRDGSDVTIDVPQHTGPWARLVQRQIREEEILQGVGRLRPVYREGVAPLVVMLTSVVPDALVVDEVCHLDDMTHDARSHAFTNEARVLSAWSAALVGDGHGIVDENLRAVAGRALTERMGHAFVHVEVEREDARPYTVLVSPDVADPVAKVEEVFAAVAKMQERAGHAEIHPAIPDSGRIVHDPREGMPAINDESVRIEAVSEAQRLRTRFRDRHAKAETDPAWIESIGYRRRGLMPGLGVYAGETATSDVWNIIMAQTAFMPEELDVVEPEEKAIATAA